MARPYRYTGNFEARNESSLHFMIANTNTGSKHSFSHFHPRDSIDAKTSAPEQMELEQEALVDSTSPGTYFHVQTDV